MTDNVKDNGPGIFIPRTMDVKNTIVKNNGVRLNKKCFNVYKVNPFIIIGCIRNVVETVDGDDNVDGEVEDDDEDMVI